MIGIRRWIQAEPTQLLGRRRGRFHTRPDRRFDADEIG